MPYTSTINVSVLNCPENEDLRGFCPEAGSPLDPKPFYAPLGSSVWTSSGQLSQRNITAIAQAASGGMKSGPGFEPTRASVAASVENSLALAAGHGYSKLAIPFIGGGIFYGRILPKISLAELAEVIVNAAENGCGIVQPVVVAFANSDVAHFKNAIAKLGATKVTVVQGSIMDHDLHGCNAIVNAANMEVMFGGGISGKIAHATQDQAGIDAEALTEVKAFWAANPAS